MPTEHAGDVHLVLDCRGQRCPTPVIKLGRHIAEVEVTEVVRVLADDPAAALDIPAWSRMRGHLFTGSTSVAGCPAFDVVRMS